MKFVLEVLRGMVIGLANIIPGVSGGTMMVSMGIYDTLIHCITHLFKEFKKSVMTLLPYAIGMAGAIGALSFALKWAFANYALPTNTLFIGLILGGLPAILRQVKGKKKGPVGAVLFLAFFALIILMQLFQSENSVTIQLSVVEVLKLFVLGRGGLGYHDHPRRQRLHDPQNFGVLRAGGHRGHPRPAYGLALR